MVKKEVQCFVILGIVMIIFLSLSAIALAEDDEEVPTPEARMNAAADELKDLMEKYENAEVDFIKHEDVNIVDMTGNAKECDMEIYYDNGEVASFSAKNGEFHGSLQYEKPVGKARCIKVYCPCKIVMVTHQQDNGEIVEALERLKKAMREYLEDKAKGAASEAGEKVAEHVLEGLGIASAPFLIGLKAGMDLGAPAGEMVNRLIELVFDHIRELDEVNYKEFGECAPSRGHKRTFPFSKLSEWLHWHDEPVLYDTWMIRLDCDQKDEGWVDPATVSPDEIARQKELERDLAEREKIRIAEQDAARIKAEDDARRAQEKEEMERGRREWDAYVLERDVKIKRDAEVIKKDCLMCKELQAAIEQKMKELQALGPQVAEVKKKLGETQSDYQRKKAEREALERLKDRFDHPRSSAYSEGKTVTESDLRAREYAERKLFDKWLKKELTSQQLADEWNKYNPEKAKEEYKQELDKAIAEAKAIESLAQEQFQQASAEAARLEQQIKDVQAAIDALNAKLADCLKLCKEHAVDIIKGTYVVPDTDPNTPPKVGTAISKDSCSDTNRDNVPDICNDANGDGVIDKAVLIGLGFTKVFKLPGGDATSKEYSSMGRVGDHVVAFTNTRNRIYLDPVILTADSMVIVNLRTQNRLTIPLIGSSPEPVPSTGTTTTTSTPTAPVSEQPPQMSCSDWCSSKGYSLTPIDHSQYILSYLNQLRCISGVHITYAGGVHSERCTCYSSEKPQISVDSTIPVCSTGCGEVPCDSSKSCSCGVRCTLTASCNWSGWKQSGDSFVPVVGANSQSSDSGGMTGQVVGYPNSITGNIIMHPSGKYWYDK